MTNEQLSRHIAERFGQVCQNHHLTPAAMTAVRELIMETQDLVAQYMLDRAKVAMGVSEPVQ